MEFVSGNLVAATDASKNDASKANAAKLLNECKAVLSRLGLMYPASGAAALSTDSTPTKSHAKAPGQAGPQSPTTDGTKPRDQIDGVMDLSQLQSALEASQQLLQQHLQMQQAVAVAAGGQPAAPQLQGDAADASRANSLGGASNASWGSSRNNSNGGGNAQAAAAAVAAVEAAAATVLAACNALSNQSHSVAHQPGQSACISTAPALAPVVSHAATSHSVTFSPLKTTYTPFLQPVTEGAEVPVLSQPQPQAGPKSGPLSGTIQIPLRAATSMPAVAIAAPVVAPLRAQTPPLAPAASATPPAVGRSPAGPLPHLAVPQPQAAMRRHSRPTCVPKLDLRCVVDGQGYDGSPTHHANKVMPGLSPCDPLVSPAPGQSSTAAEEEEMAAELAMWAAPARWFPAHEGRMYVYKPVSSQEVKKYEELQAELPTAVQPQVAAMWDCLIRARYATELMASRAVRVAKDVTHEWTELSQSLMERLERAEAQVQDLRGFLQHQTAGMERLEQENAELKQQLVQAQAAATCHTINTPSSGQSSGGAAPASGSSWGRTFGISRLLQGRQACGGASGTGPGGMRVKPTAAARAANNSGAGSCGDSGRVGGHEGVVGQLREENALLSAANADLESELRDVQGLFMDASEQLADANARLSDSEQHAQELWHAHQVLGAQLATVTAARDDVSARAHDLAKQRDIALARCMDLEMHLVQAGNQLHAATKPKLRSATQVAAVNHGSHMPQRLLLQVHASTGHGTPDGLDMGSVFGSTSEAALAALNGSASVTCAGSHHPIGPCSAAVCSVACEDGSANDSTSSATLRSAGSFDWLAKVAGSILGTSSTTSSNAGSCPVSGDVAHLPRVISTASPQQPAHASGVTGSNPAGGKPPLPSHPPADGRKHVRILSIAGDVPSDEELMRQLQVLQCAP